MSSRPGVGGFSLVPRALEIAAAPPTTPSGDDTEVQTASGPQVDDPIGLCILGKQSSSNTKTLLGSVGTTACEPGLASELASDIELTSSLTSHYRTTPSSIPGSTLYRCGLLRSNQHRGGNRIEKTYSIRFHYYQLHSTGFGSKFLHLFRITPRDPHDVEAMPLLSVHRAKSSDISSSG